MVVAGGGHWGMMSSAPAAALLPGVLFPGKGAFCDFPSTKSSCCSETGPCILLSLQLFSPKPWMPFKCQSIPGNCDFSKACFTQGLDVLELNCSGMGKKRSLVSGGKGSS